MDRVRVARIVRLRRASDILPYDFMEAPGSDSWVDDPDSGDSYDAGFNDAKSGEMNKNPDDPAYVAGFGDGAKADRDPSEGTLDPFVGAKDEDEDPCWDDYEQMGMKTKDGKEVPNCIPKSSRVAMPWFADPSKGYTGEYCDEDGCYESDVDWQNEEKYHHKGVVATCAISPVQARHIVSDIEEISSNLPFQVARDSKGRYFLRIFDMRSTLLEMYNRIDIAEDNVQSGYASERFEWMGNLRSYKALANKLKAGKFKSYASKGLISSSRPYTMVERNNLSDWRVAMPKFLNGESYSGEWCDADGCYIAPGEEENHYHLNGLVGTCAISWAQHRNIQSETEDTLGNTAPCKTATDSKGRPFLRIFDLDATINEMEHRAYMFKMDAMEADPWDKGDRMTSLAKERSFDAIANKLKRGDFKSYA